MKKLTTIFILIFALVQLGEAQQADIPAAKPGIHYGDKIDKKNSIDVTQLQKEFDKKPNYQGKIEGEVVQVCKKKGCFLTLKIPGSVETVMVRFTDYGYFVPQDMVGKTVVVAGKAKVKESSVEWQKHYAEDLGKSKEEIAKITTPKKEISIVADGVLVIK